MLVFSPVVVSHMFVFRVVFIRPCLFFVKHSQPSQPAKPASKPIRRSQPAKPASQQVLKVPSRGLPKPTTVIRLWFLTRASAQGGHETDCVSCTILQVKDYPPKDYLDKPPCPACPALSRALSRGLVPGPCPRTRPRTRPQDKAPGQGPGQCPRTRPRTRQDKQDKEEILYI